MNALKDTNKNNPHKTCRYFGKYAAFVSDTHITSECEVQMILFNGKLNTLTLYKKYLKELN